VGDSIRGRFKTEVTYPPESQASSSKAPASPPSDQPKPRTSMRFKTQRPIFADPGLERLLEEKSVVIEAVDESGSSWFNLLVGFGPTVLLIGAFVWLSRRAAAAAMALRRVPQQDAAMGRRHRRLRLRLSKAGGDALPEGLILLALEEGGGQGRHRVQFQEADGSADPQLLFCRRHSADGGLDQGKQVFVAKPVMNETPVVEAGELQEEPGPRRAIGGVHALFEGREEGSDPRPQELVVGEDPQEPQGAAGRLGILVLRGLLERGDRAVAELQEFPLGFLPLDNAFGGETLDQPRRIVLGEKKEEQQEGHPEGSITARSGVAKPWK